MGGSPLRVSAPAAGLTVVVADLVAQFGWAVTCMITMTAGALQVVLGLGRVARAAFAIPPVVVHAILAGIGITIALQQAHVLSDGQSKSSAWHNIIGLPEQLLEADGGSLIVGMLIITTLIAWRWVPRPLAYIPGPLVAIVAVTIISLVFPFHLARITLDGSLLDALQLPGPPDGNWGALGKGVIIVALIASIERLLSAVSVDRMHGMWNHIETARRSGDIVVYLITPIGGMFLSLLQAVLMGLLVAAGLIGWRVIRAKIACTRPNPKFPLMG